MMRQAWFHVPRLSLGALELLAKVKSAGGRLESLGLNGAHVVELLVARLVDVERGVVIVTRWGNDFETSTATLGP